MQNILPKCSFCNYECNLTLKSDVDLYLGRRRSFSLVATAQVIWTAPISPGSRRSSVVSNATIKGMFGRAEPRFLRLMGELIMRDRRREIDRRQSFPFSLRDGGRL